MDHDSPADDSATDSSPGAHCPGDDPDVTGGQGPDRVYGGAFELEPVVGPLLFIHDFEDQEKWGNVIHLGSDDDLVLSPELTDELKKLGDWYDDSIDWGQPGGPPPWPQDERDRFNQALRDTVQRLRDELGPTWDIWIESGFQHEHPTTDPGHTSPASPASPATDQDPGQHLDQRRSP